jgi:hypothetical protein
VDGIFYQSPPVFVGGRQPYAPEELTPPSGPLNITATISETYADFVGSLSANLSASPPPPYNTQIIQLLPILWDHDVIFRRAVDVSSDGAPPPPSNPPPLSTVTYQSLLAWRPPNLGNPIVMPMLVQSGPTSVAGTISETYADFALAGTSTIIDAASITVTYGAFVGSLQGGVGALFTINTAYADFVASVNLTVPTLSATPGAVRPNKTGLTINLVGFDTSWTSGTPGSPTFTLSSTGSGASITAQTVLSATTATLTISSGTAGTITITDPSTGAIAHVASFASGAGPIFGPVTGLVSGVVFGEKSRQWP